MLNYLIRRLILLPLTLLGIILVNFAIINLAPGDPITVTEVNAQGANRREDSSMAFGQDDRYLQFREHYGLTLPILYNDWPEISQEGVIDSLQKLVNGREKMDVKSYDRLRILLGDQSPFIMPKLLNVIDNASSPQLKQMASRYFARGATHQAFLGSSLSADQKAYNHKIAIDNQKLRSLIIEPSDTPEQVDTKTRAILEWYEQNTALYNFEPTFWGKVRILFIETRFIRYMSRIVTLNFGTLRNDDTKTVISEVVRRFKYSLTLAILPMLLTFVACTAFGLFMAYYQNRWPDISLNVLFLILYAIPVFVVAPFLIEAVAVNGHFPFIGTPIPYSGFTSPDRIYLQQTSWQRLVDVLQHIFLPIVAIIYGSLAVQARISRTAVLEVLHQDYIRTARAKGVGPAAILYRHVGRNAAITIVTSIAGSLGIVLGGSLIVETLFDINGFGKFFYDAVINWDYNVIMFSALAGSFLTLLGYLVGDIAYTLLDPRLTLE